MNHRNPIQIIKQKSGFSMLFVLAVLLLLMAIGTSALVAASAGTGATASKRAHDQLNLYADSMQRTVRKALQSGSSLEKMGSTELEATLAGMILRKVEELYFNSPSTDSLSITMIPSKDSISGIDLSVIIPDEIQINIANFQDGIKVRDEVKKSNEVTDVEGRIIKPASPWQPKLVSIDATVVIAIKVIDIKNNKNYVNSVATYDWTGAYLEQESEESENPPKLIIKNTGEWRLVSYEKLDD